MGGTGALYFIGTTDKAKTRRSFPIWRHFYKTEKELAASSKPWGKTSHSLFGLIL